MQNRYFGDVGDFGKYGLLRQLTGVTSSGQNLRLGVVWYLVPDEGHNDDGKHVSYLGKPEYAACDPKLHSGLKALLSDGIRTVAKIQNSELLPSNTIYFDELLSFEGPPKSIFRSADDRARYREAWISNAIRTVRSADVIFLDPDNGLEVKSVKRLSKKGPKYVYWDEVKKFSNQAQTLVIYHHLNRTTSSLKQIELKIGEFRGRLPEKEVVIPVLFKRGSHRVFFILPSQAHGPVIENRLREMANSSWAPHIDILN